MANVLIAAYLLIVLALIGVILLQRSEGGALGIGGNANFTQIRTQGNILTRTTAILAVLFFATAIGLTVLSELDRSSDSILGGDDEPTSVLDELNRLGTEAPPPATDATTPPSPAADPALPVPTIEAPATTGGPAASTSTEPSAPATGETPATSAPAASGQPATPAPADPALPVPASP